ncbi:4-hydroxyphenylpyruvic acid dioxgenase [Thamnocephalis sphaerospora]|uniref:4-hydroxyphenylpyruvate dioxygenase n=1 Tax=Thamnocephalis sphaerospora TaxID=78915 RepID=A0A4P9XWH2_9FUNG|nr:4-hydroxyphenylpyruvic acid dioxgenase [Thamnocephalis sphaerospora]|eukprot:RKP10685.1 4-hydroxyphenylpyruvic acid dioxgenase [Thamnocephalis sphaerospora]
MTTPITTSHIDKDVEPAYGSMLGFDHVTYWVGNAKQAASFYTTRYGFKQLAYRGLETGHRSVCSHVISLGNIVFVFQSALTPNNKEISSHHATHGDGVKDVALTVEDARAVWQYAVNNGARSIRAPWEETDEHGTVVMATIATYGDTEHTFVERKNYSGPFLPGFSPPRAVDPLEELLPHVPLDVIDHVAGNQPESGIASARQIYEKQLHFRRFWSVDDVATHTEYSSMLTMVVADHSTKIRLPLNEPTAGKKRSQVQEYVDYYGSAGVQHIALRTDDIITAVDNMRKRGAVFLTVPPEYYKELRKKLQTSRIKIAESLDELQRLSILVDYDEKGYLLQTFIMPMQDRPTAFLEIIQRNNNQGFGVNNFQALFEAFEREQEARGNF